MVECEGDIDGCSHVPGEDGLGEDVVGLYGEGEVGKWLGWGVEMSSHCKAGEGRGVERRE